MKVGFVTCVQLGLSCIRAIEASGGRLDFIITLRDDIAPAKSGRVFLDDYCSSRAIPLLKVRNINDPECIEFLRRNDVDYLFIIGWSQIAGPAVLSSVRNIIGAHPTLLPEGRGRAAIPWAILKGLNETGVTLFVLDEGVDTGDIVTQQRLPIAPDETATSLYERVACAHADAIAGIWPSLMAGTLPRAPQDHGRATEWPGRKPRDGEIHVSMTVDQVDRLVRATTRPYPGAFFRECGGLVRIWAGAPAHGEVPAGCRRIQLANGSYDATEWQLEASTPS